MDQQLGITLVLLNGVIPADEWLAHLHQLTTDPTWPPSRRLHLSDIQSGFLDSSMAATVLAKAADLFGKSPIIANTANRFKTGKNQAKRLFLKDSAGHG